MRFRPSVAVLVTLLATLASAWAAAAGTKGRPEDSSLFLEADRDAEKLLAAAREAARGSRWRQAVEAYQRVADFAGRGGAQPLVASPADPSVYIPIQDLAALELARLPRPALEVYREAYDGPAQAAFERAVAAKDTAALAALARRHLASSWGDDALAALGAIAFERGDYAGALAAWGRLLEAHPDPSVPLASVRARMWACLRALGRAPEADGLARELRSGHAAEALRLGDKSVSVEQFLALPVAPSAPASLADWPALGGDATHARTAAGIAEVGGPLWRFAVPNPTVRQADLPQFERRGLPLPFALHPTAVGNTLFVASDTALAALSAETGRLAWLYPDAPEIPLTPATGEAIHSGACHDGRVFVCLGHGVSAFDAATGRLLWHHAFASAEQPAKEEEPAAKGDAKDAEEGDGKPKRKPKAKKEASLGSKVITYIAPPVVAGRRVLVGLTRLGDEARSTLLALDAATGHELWTTFVCSRSIPAFLGLGAAASPAAACGSTVYYSTNLGAIAALDLATGTLRWVQRYPSYPNPLRQATVERHQRWGNNPPVAEGGYVFATPQDSGWLIAVDAASGSIAWTAPRDGGRYLVGGDAGRLLVAGASVQAIDCHTGKRLWKADLPDALQGRPALCQGRLYLATDRALVAARTSDGALTTCREWQADEGPGNIVVAGGALFVASCDRVHAFADWESTRASLEAKAKQDAGDPTVPLALGVHEAQRGAHAAAVPHFEEALRLAKARNDATAARRICQAMFHSYYALGHPGDAAALSSALACSTGPEEKVQALVALARLHEQQTRLPQAVAAWQAVLAEAGSVRWPLDGTLTVSAQALATAEIARLVRVHGRPVYAAAEAAASQALAAAKDAAAREAVVRRFPNSAAAEQALVELLAAPDARALAPHVTALAHLLPPEAASDTRGAAEAKLRTLGAVAHAGRPPLSRLWQVQTRIAHRRVQLLTLDGAAPGRLYFATARRTSSHALPFDAVECRLADTGALLWGRDLGEWDGEALLTGGCLIVSNFDRIIALDPAIGVERWACSLAPGGAAEPGPEEPEPKEPPRPRGRPGLLDREPDRPRNERRRVVALAGDARALYASLAGGSVLAFSLDNGTKLWEREFKAHMLLAEGLFVEGGKVWVCAESPASVYALDTANGTGGPAFTFKRQEITGRAPRVTDRPARVPGQGRVYLVLDDRAVHALDLKTGRDLWEASVDFSVSQVIASPDGRSCYVLPGSYVHNGQIVSLDPRTGEVRRRRSVVDGQLTDAALGPDALYVAERGNELILRSLDPEDLGERWRTAPLLLVHPSRIARSGRYVAVSGRHAGRNATLVISTATGKIVGDLTPPGVEEVSAALAADLLVLGTDRGIHAYGPAEPGAIDQQVAALDTRVGAGDRSALPALANALYQRGDEEKAIGLLAGALADEALPDADYASLKDALNSLRESLALRRPAVLHTPRMAVPPDIDGVIDDPWHAEAAAHLDGPAYIEEIQGLPAAETRWRSPSDLSAVLYTGWDDRYFYFAIDVNDDVHRTYTSQNDTWVGDGLVISVDCENDGGYGYRFTGKDLLLTLALTRKDERRDDDEGDEPTGEYRVRLKEDNSGAVYEVAIPWEYLGLRDVKPGLRMGFNITVLDDDADRAVKAISWTPGMILDRDRGLMIRGFTPAYFGKVELTGPTTAPPPLWPPATSPSDSTIRIQRIRPPKEK